ncbi:MAG TPA: M48 family metalloprotease [Candidatus Binatia bacterium]|nr:M48 family metalloprotease [Candidatus Binatia bacterium]
MITDSAEMPWSRLCCAWLVILGLLLGGCGQRLSSVIPSISPPAEDEEVKISRDFRREAKKHFKFVTHPEVERYIDRLGQRILLASGPQAYDYRFFIVEDNQLNAFAVPGGSIYFFSGLIERAKSTSEIAGVLGHEIIHIKGRHMARSSGPDATSVLSLLAMVLLARTGEGAQAAGVVGQAISATRQMAYSRQLELEADTLGARYMAAAGFDPKGALAFLKTLDEDRALNPINIPAYLMTHPVTQERVANIQQVIRSLGEPPVRADEPDALKKIQIILRLERRDDTVLAEYEKLAAQQPDNGEILYLLGFARQLKGQLKQALQNYEQARKLTPKNPALLRDTGRLYTQLGSTEEAEAALQRSLELQPKEPLTYLYFGELYQHREDYRSAVGAYLNAHTLAPQWDKPAHLLSVAYGKLDRLGDAYYYLGRSLLLQDEDEKAFAAFDRAAKLAGVGSPRAQSIREELNSLRARRK